MAAVRWWVIAEAVQYKFLEIIIFQYVKAIKAFRKTSRVKEGQIQTYFQINFAKSSLYKHLKPNTESFENVMARAAISINERLPESSLAHAEVWKVKAQFPFAFHILHIHNRWKSFKTAL